MKRTLIFPLSQGQPMVILLAPKQLALAVVLLVFFNSLCFAQHKQLRSAIQAIADSSSGKIGVFIKVMETADTLSFHDNGRYVMQSVFKFPIAIMVLKEIDAGKLSLNQTVFVRKSDLHKTVSALYDKYPGGEVNVTIREMLTDMITLSDNNACDLLLKAVGGPVKVEHFINGLGVTQFRMRVDESEMHEKWNNQYLNWSTPSALVKLLELVYEQKVLSLSHNALLRAWMKETYVTPKRIRYLLPAGSVVEHRSGTSSTNDQGLSPATNDIATITLPNGKHLGIAILITDSHDGSVERDSIIARIAKAAFDEFSTR